jgi:hypothetical protein
MSYILCLAIYGQKEDYSWVLGANVLNTIDFTEVGFSIDTFQPSPYVRLHITNSIISDPLGNRLLFSGGAAIYDETGEIIIGGDSINPGFLRESWQVSPAAYPSKNAAIFLNSLKNINDYFLFHVRADSISELDSTILNSFGTNIFYTQIERNSLNEFYVEKKYIYSV